MGEQACGLPGGGGPGWGMIVLGPTDQGTADPAARRAASDGPRAWRQEVPGRCVRRAVFSPGALRDGVWPLFYLPLLLVTLGVGLINGSL